DVELAGITLIAVRTGQRQDELGDRAIFDRLHHPIALVEALCTAVERVCPVVPAECMAFAVELESGARNAVGIAAYRHPKIVRLLCMACQAGAADRYVGAFAAAIRRDE